MAFDWNRGLLPQLVDGVSDATKQRLQDMVSGKGLVGQENAAADLEMRKRQGIAASPVSVVDTPNDMAAATRRAQGILVPADQPDPQREAFARGQSLISSLPQPTRPAATELQPLLTTALPTITAQPAPAAPSTRITSGLGGNRLTVEDYGNGGTVEGNVAAINRQTEALRSLNEARGVYGQGGGGDNRAFGDLVSIGRAGESFGDDAMRAESAKRLVSQATGSSWVQNNRQRQGMLEGAGILMGMNQLDTSPRRQAPNPLAMTDYQRGQLGLSRDQLATDTLTQQNQNDLALKRFGLDQGIAQSTQALGRDRFSLDQSNALANQALKRDELGVEREKNQASLAAAMSKANPYQQTLVQEQAKTDIERSKANEEMRRHAADYFEKSRRLREIAPNTGLVNSGLASAGALFNSDRAAEKERFDALNSGMVLSAIKQLGTNPSNTDLKFVQKAVLDYGKTPEGNQQILNDMDAFMLGKLRAAGVDTNEFTQKPAATSSSAVSMDAVNQRGAALAAQGMSDAEIDATLRKEFALNGR